MQCVGVTTSWEVGQPLFPWLIGFGLLNSELLFTHCLPTPHSPYTCTLHRNLRLVGVTSFLGVAAVFLWALSTLGLAVAAVVKGEGHHVNVWPDVSKASQEDGLCAVLCACLFVEGEMGEGAVLQMVHAGMMESSWGCTYVTVECS
jgi:hypothetical protein